MADPDMHELQWQNAMVEIEALHAAKRRDYGSNEDAWANIRVSELYGVPAWQHASMLVDHKSRRIQTFVQKGRLEHEGVRDSLVDRIVYALAALVLFDEEAGGPGGGKEPSIAVRSHPPTDTDSQEWC